MNRYEYKARDVKGKVYKGYLECSGEMEFYRKLEEKNMFCIEMRQVNTKVESAAFGTRWKSREIAVFCREFSIMLSAGMNMLTAIKLLYERAGKGNQKKCYMLILEGIEKGDSLYDSMRKQKSVFPPLLMAMVLAGESSGNIDTVMGKMALYYEKEADLNARMVNAMIYPMVLISITVGVVLLLFTFVLPQFFGLFEGKDVPGITRIFMNISGFLTEFWYVLLLVVLGVVLVVGALKRSEHFNEQFDRIILKIPIFGALVEKLIVARFANAMNILYSSGIMIVQSINISIGTVSNRYISAGLLKVSELIEKGVSLSDALQREKIFDNMIWSMVQIGEESGSLEHMFEKMSEYYTKESETTTQKMMALFEPLILVVIAVIIAVVVISVLLPIYNMYEM